MRTISQPRKFSRRRGVVYLVVLGTAMIATLLAMSGLLALRARRRVVTDMRDAVQARFYAQAAVEIGLQKVANDSDWRNNLTSGNWVAEQSLGEGSYCLDGTDPNDGDLADSDTDSLVLTGTGKFGRARQSVTVTILPKQDPLQALNSAVHAGGDLVVQSDAALNLENSPASANGNAQIDGAISGSLQSVTTSGGGSVSGTSTTIEPLELPAADLVDTYVNMATPIPFTGTFEKKVLAPGYNDFGGGLNGDGLYYLNTGGNNVEIKTCRIHGTLVVDAGANTVKLSERVLLENHHPDYPALIVRGKLHLAFNQSGDSMDETAYAVNWNPAGAGYEGNSDATLDDTYPSEIRGLIHATGAITVEHDAKILGGLLGEGNVVFAGGSPTIVHDEMLATNPPVGYLSEVRLVVSQGSFRRNVD